MNKNINDMPKNMLCPCGGGQSCIVDRRWLGDWVYEDDILLNAGLPIRKNCYQEPSVEQLKILSIFTK